MATTNGISLAPDNLEEEVAHLMAQELPYTVFDTDTEVAVASMLNAKLEFDETLLAENMVLNCGPQGGRGQVEGVVQDLEMQENIKENESEDEDSSHYFKFSRTVVCDAASGSEASGHLPSTQSISQLDGADGGSESEESEAADDSRCRGEYGETKVCTNDDTPTKQLTVALKRLEYTVPASAVEQGITESQKNPSASALLDSGYADDEMSLQEEEVQVNSEAPAFHDEVFLDSATGHFVSAEDGSVVYPRKVEDKDETNSSAESVEGFKDDLNDPDYSPEPVTKKSPVVQMKTIILKSKRPPTNLKRLSPKPYLQQQPNVKLLLPPRSTGTVNNASVSPAAASFCTVPCTVTSPIMISGLNTLPTQSGATRSRTIAIRLDRPESQQQVLSQNDAVAANSPPAAPSSPQVLLVNRQGQILIKDPRTNTYQSLNTNSPAYNKISQIAKILHSGNALRRSVPHVIIKPRSSSTTANAPSAVNHTITTDRKIIVRVVPAKSSATPTPTAPVSDAALANIEESTAQAIIDRAMATHRDTLKTKPIVLSNTQQPKAKRQRSSQFRVTGDSDQSPVSRTELPSSFLKEPDSSLRPTPASSRSQVRIKRVSSLSERPSKKKSKMDFLRDPSSELDEFNEARY